MNRVLVTGSSGFVGSAICEALIERGCAVVGMDRAPSRFSGLGFDWVEAVTFVPGDLRDAGTLRGLFDAHEISHVVHAAALTPDAAREKAFPDQIIDVNVTGACRLMQAAARRPPRRVVHLSSISAYGAAVPGRSGRFEEDGEKKPEGLYGISKLAGEMAVRRLAALEGMDLRVVRLGPLFGPWEHASGARDVLSPHHQIATAARARRACILPRAVPADWLYSRDGARRIVDVLLAGALDGDTFNLGGGAITNLIDWCDAIGESFPGFEWSIDPAAPTVRYGYPGDRPALDNSRLDAACPSFATPTGEAAIETLAWLDRVEPVLQITEDT